MCRAYLLQSMACVLLLRHHVAPEKAEQRRGEKKEALPSDNTSAANLCKTLKAPELVLLSPRPSCKAEKESRERRHCWLQTPLSRPGGSVCTRQEEAERAGPVRPGTNREPAHPPPPVLSR